MRTARTFFIAMIICTLAGCAGRTTAPATPGPADPPTPAPEPIIPVPSVINIPAEIKTAYLEKAVNDQLKGTIYRNNALPVEKIGTAQVTVKKDGQIKIRAAGNELTYKVPLKISMRLPFTILGHTEYKDVDAGIEIALRSRYTLRNNWKLTTTTTVEGYEWTTNPTVKIRFVTIPVKPVADLLLSKQSGTMNELGKAIDKAITNSINVKTMVTPIWEQLQTPTEIAVPDMPERLWLRFNPTDIYMTKISGQGRSISAMIGIRAVTETFIGEKPAARKPKPLPDFKTPDKQDSSFTINLYAQVPFDKATAICRELFIGKTFKSGRQKVLVHDIEISGTNDGLAKIKMDLSGSLKGTVHVTGQAIFNEKTQTVTLDDFDLDVETKNKYQQAKNWLLKGIIMAKMKPMMKFPMEKTLDDAKVLVQQMLTDYEIYKGIVLNGRVDALTVRGVEVTDEGLRAVVTAKGVAGVKVRE